MLQDIWKKVADIWTFLNTPGKKVAEDSLLVRVWKFLASPFKFSLPSEAVVEFLEVACLMIGMGVMILVMLGARGKVSKCLYWSVATYFVLQILF